MRVGVRGNLRQMRDAQDLKRRPEGAELAPDDVGDAPADAGVDFVEDQTGRRRARRTVGGVAETVARRGNQGLDREHDARQLAARDNARERPQVLAWIRRDEELPSINSSRAPAGLGLQPVAKPHLEARALHGQLREDGLELPAERDGNLPPLFRERLGSADEGRPRGGELALELYDPVVAAIEVDQFPPERVPPLDDIGQRGAVFPLQAFEQGEALFHLLQPRGRCFDAGHVLPEKSGEVFELRLDAVARVEIRLELRIEGRQLRHAAPDVPEARQNGIVALVKRRVAVGAEPLHPVGARKHVAQGRELDIFPRIARSQPGAIELARLKGNQILAAGAVPGRAAHPGELVLHRAHRVERSRGRRRHLIEPAERIDDAQMRGRIEQRLVFMLPVQLDQTGRQILQRAGVR